MKTPELLTALATAVWLAASPAAAEETIEMKLAEYMNRAAAEGYTGAVLVAREGKVLFARGYGTISPDSDRPITQETVSTTGSITKQFTAAAILKLEEMGRLAVDDSIAKYFADVPDDKAGITIHHLLSHQAGFPGAIGDDRERIGRDAFVAQALATELVFEPGSGYEYSNVGFSLAAAIVELVSGQDYETFLHEHLFEPAEMHDTGYRIPAWDKERLAHGRKRDGSDWGTVVENMIADGGPGWHLLGNGGIHSTATDMFRWHQALQDESILSAAAKRKMYARHADEGGGTWYGYGWSIEPTPWGEMITHNGGNPYYFADFLRFPEHDVVIYVWNVSHDRRMNRIGRPLARIVFTGEVPPFPKAPAPLQEPGSGPPAPAGSLAAKWGLPGSIRGQRAAELLEAVTRSEEDYRRQFVREGFAPRVIERNGLDGLLALLNRLDGDLGEFRLRGARPAGEHEAHVVLDSPRGTVELTLELEPAPPHRIAGIRVEIGD